MQPSLLVPSNTTHRIYPAAHLLLVGSSDRGKAFVLDLACFCAMEHLLLWSTYRFLIKEYAAFVTWLADAA